MPSMIPIMFSSRKKVLIKFFGVKTQFLQLTLMEIEKFFFQVCSPRDRENAFAHSCSFTLQTSYKNGMLGPGGGGKAVKMHL